jgi:hypothetical protein
MEEQAARAASLAQGAGDAAGAFQQAAQAPMPQVNPMAELLRMIGGGSASIMGETPRYANNAQADLASMKDELLAKRAQNLAALKDNYDRQAAAAQSAGDLLAEAKLRKSAESVSKAWQAIHDESAAKQSMNELDIQEKGLDRRNKEDNASAERRALIAAGAKGQGGAAGEQAFAEEIEEWAERVNSGQTRLLNVPLKIRTKVMQEMRAKGYSDMPPAARAAVAGLGGSRMVINELADLALGPLAADSTRSGGLNEAGSGIDRAKQGIGLSFGALTQANPNAAVYSNIRDSWLSALAKMTGQVGTLSDKDIEYAKKLPPTLYDTREVAEKKISAMERFVNERINATIKAYSTALTGSTPSPAVTKTTLTPKAEALTAARKGDRAKLVELIKANPSLNDDPDLLAQAERMRSK